MQLPDFSKAIKSYSGRPGCMCGCRGNWYRTSHSEKSYHDVSDRSVKILMNKLSKAEGVVKEDMGDEECYYLETPTRVLGVYFKK